MVGKHMIKNLGKTVIVLFAGMYVVLIYQKVSYAAAVF